MKTSAVSILLTATLFLFPFKTTAADNQVKKRPDLAQMHNLLMMMNHGFMMVLDGYNLVMISEINTSPDLDQFNSQNGYGMIERGKDIINEVPSAEEMIDIHRKGLREDQFMTGMHETGKSMLRYIKLLESRTTGLSLSADRMALHHIQILITHTLRTAAESSNMILLGNKEFICDVSDFTIRIGGVTLIEARTLLNEVVNGKKMKEMESRGITPENNQGMKLTRDMIDEANKIINYYSMN